MQFSRGGGSLGLLGSTEGVLLLPDAIRGAGVAVACSLQAILEPRNCASGAGVDAMTWKRDSNRGGKDLAQGVVVVVLEIL
ncbi:hypothetical protein DFQ26_002820 [Actinomortierella ambigua]|nr:hypothetical protein DFQ26_002820 [Actinomortierella ambigua]